MAYYIVVTEEYDGQSAVPVAGPPQIEVRSAVSLEDLCRQLHEPESRPGQTPEDYYGGEEIPGKTWAELLDRHNTDGGGVAFTIAELAVGAGGLTAVRPAGMRPDYTLDGTADSTTTPEKED